MSDSPAAIIRDLAGLDGVSAAEAVGRLHGLSRRAQAIVNRWEAMQAPAPRRQNWRCPMCGAATADNCRAYGPESVACYRYA